jgi:predicted RNA binding protein YcfA (HicA-like mRNA interferase family)
VPKLPGINHRDAVRALQKVGFRIAREGKHVVMTDGKRILTIPRANPVNAVTMGVSCAMPGFPSTSSRSFYSPAV